MKLEDLLKALENEDEVSGVDEELRTNMTQMVAWYYIRFRGKERGVDVEEFGSACMSYVLAAYVANENTCKKIERVLGKGGLDEEGAELAKNTIHVMALQTIEKEVEDYMRENGDGRTLEEAGGENKISFEDVRRATEEVNGEKRGTQVCNDDKRNREEGWANGMTREEEEDAHRRDRESRTPGEGKAMFQNMGYVQLILDLDTLNMAMVPLHVYQLKTGVEGEDGEEVCEYVYFVPKTERVLQGTDGEEPEFEYLNEEEGVGIQTLSSLKDIAYEAFTTFGRDEEDEEDEDAKFVRDQVKMFEEAYYNCELLKKGNNVVSLFRLRSLYGGLLGEDEALEEVMRAFKSLKGNIMIKIAGSGTENREMFGMVEKVFDEEMFEMAARANLKALLENVEKIDKRWF